MLVRPALESDLPAVEKLEQQLFSSPWSLNQLNKAFNAGQWMWLVERQSKVVGYLIASHGGGVADLLTVGVDSSLQRCGIGRRLLQALFEQLETMAVDELFLEVRRSNISAIELYQRSGMESVGVRKNYYPCGRDGLGKSGREDAIVMRYLVPSLG